MTRSPEAFAIHTAIHVNVAYDILPIEAGARAFRGVAVPDLRDAGWQWMSFFVRRLQPGDTFQVRTVDEEAAFVLLGGQCAADRGLGPRDFDPTRQSFRRITIRRRSSRRPQNRFHGRGPLRNRRMPASLRSALTVAADNEKTMLAFADWLHVYVSAVLPKEKCSACVSAVRAFAEFIAPGQLSDSKVAEIKAFEKDAKTNRQLDEGERRAGLWELAASAVFGKNS